MVGKINNLILELNSTCNNNCIYCYLPEQLRFRKHANSFEYFKTVLLEFKDKNIQNLDITGGEPTLLPELEELVSYAKKLGYNNITLVSNGRMLSYASKCSNLIRKGVRRIVITLDADSEFLGDAISRAPGSFKQVLKAAVNVKKFGAELGLTMVINKLNYRNCEKVIEKAISLKADFFSIQFLLPHIENSTVPCRKIHKSVIPRYDESIKFVKSSLDKYGKRIKISLHFIAPCLMKGYEKYIEPELNKSDRFIVDYLGNRYYISEHLKKGATRIKECSGCKYFSNCPGLFFSYAKELGINNMLNKNG